MNAGVRSNIWSLVAIVAMALGVILSAYFSLGVVKLRTGVGAFKAEPQQTQASIETIDQSQNQVTRIGPNVASKTASSNDQSQSSQTVAPGKIEVNVVSSSTGNSNSSSQTIVNSSSFSSSFSQSQTSVQTSGEHVSVTQ